MERYSTWGPRVPATGDAPPDQHAQLLPRYLLVRGPRSPLAPALTSAPLVALASTGYPFSLEIRATRQAVSSLIGSYPDQSDELARAVRGAAPDWEVVPADPPRPPVADQLRHLSRLQRQAAAWVPLCSLEAFAIDPLVGLLEATPLVGDEQLLVRLLVRPAPPDLVERCLPQLTRPLPPSSGSELIGWLFGGAPRVPIHDPKTEGLILDRLASVRFEVLGVVALAGRDAQRLESLARSLTAAIRARPDDLDLGPWTWWATPETLPSSWPGGTHGLSLTPGELASLWHPPSAQVRLAGVAFADQTLPPPPAALFEQDGLLLGIHQFRGEALPIRLPVADLRAGPLIILGKTGVGKSTLGQQLLAQTARQDDRPAIGLCDPHGDWALDFAGRSIPPERLGETFLIEFGDTDWPIGLPLFTRPPGVSVDAFVSQTFQTIKLLFREQWSPTRMESAIWAAVSTLCTLPGASVRDLERLFRDATFRHRALGRADADPTAREFFLAYERLSETAQRELLAPILYRLGALYRAGPIRRILCRTDGLDPAALIDEGAILLFSFAGAEIEAEADLLMELVVARLNLGLRARLSRPPGTRRPTVLAIDESQRIRGPSLPSLIAEGRKMGVSLVLLTQFLDNWSEQVSRAVLGNTASLVAFGLGPDDSRRLAPLVRPYTAEQLLEQDRYQAVAKLYSDGRMMPATTMRTVPVEDHPNEVALAQIRAQTRARFARPRAEVEALFYPQTHQAPGCVEHAEIEED